MWLLVFLLVFLNDVGVILLLFVIMLFLLRNSVDLIRMLLLLFLLVFGLIVFFVDMLRSLLIWVMCEVLSLMVLFFEFLG